jgi:hypothetical protein
MAAFKQTVQKIFRLIYTETVGLLQTTVMYYSNFIYE